MKAVSCLIVPTMQVKMTPLYWCHCLATNALCYLLSALKILSKIIEGGLHKNVILFKIYLDLEP